MQIFFPSLVTIFCFPCWCLSDLTARPGLGKTATPWAQEAACWSRSMPAVVSQVPWSMRGTRLAPDPGIFRVAVAALPMLMWPWGMCPSQSSAQSSHGAVPGPLGCCSLPKGCHCPPSTPNCTQGTAQRRRCDVTEP